jgi:hypothetical protein
MSEDNREQSDKEKRSYFRVDDIISVIANPVNVESEEGREVIRNSSSSRSFSLLHDAEDHGGSGDGDYSDAPDVKKLYDMISEVKTKVDFIINHLFLEKEGLLTPEKKFVNISASGIRFVIDHPVKEKDVMEIKLLLPTYPPVAVFAYAEVIRVKEMEDNKYEVAVEYLNMGESVRNEIVQYTLGHQREIIRNQRESGANEQG